MAGVRAKWRTISSLSEEYEEIKELGRGSYGRCVLAVHKATNEYCCVKILFEHDYFTRREVDLLRLLTVSHSYSGIATYRDHFIIDYEEGGVLNYCIVMDYVAGYTLRDLTRRVHSGLVELTDQLLFSLVRSGLQTLAFLHDTVHIAHRDVKPSNIVINQSGEMVLIDFGLSIMMTNKAPQEDCGTPNYMSPSLVLVSRGEQEATNELWYASDIWGLGASLYYLCTGGEIAELHESDPEKSFDQIMMFRCPRTIHPHRKLNEILTSMLCINYQKQESASTLLARLEEIDIPRAIIKIVTTPIRPRPTATRLTKEKRPPLRSISSPLVLLSPARSVAQDEKAKEIKDSLAKLTPVANRTRARSRPLRG